MTQPSMATLALARADYQLARYQQSAKAYQAARASAQQTQFTWVQRSTGTGWSPIVVVFDVIFTDEPVFGAGATLQSIDRPQYYPVPSALVTAWSRDANTGGYVGATVLLSVDLRFAAGLVLNRTGTGGGSDAAVPVVAHHLTFSGPAVSKTPNTATAARSTGMDT